MRMQKVLRDEKEIHQHVYLFPTSSILEQGKNCNQALQRIADRIDMDRIYVLVEKAPFTTELQKVF